MNPVTPMLLAGCTAGLLVLSSCISNPADDASGATSTTIVASSTTPTPTVGPTTTAPSETSTTAPATTIGTTTSEPPPVAAPTGDDFEIVRGCAQTFHTPLDENSLSFIRWTFDAPGLADDTAVEVQFSDGGTTFTRVRNHEVIAEQGISAYGTYDYPSVAWTPLGGLEIVITADGTHVVDEREGDPSQTCVG